MVFDNVLWRGRVVAPGNDGGVPWSGVNPEVCDLIAAW